VLLLAGDGHERAWVERGIRQRGLASSVRLLGRRADVRDLYHLADVNVVASHREGFSNVVLEAMAAGTPQVLTDVGGNAEAVGTSGAGLLVPAGEPQTLARELLRVLGDGALADSMRRAARDRVNAFSVNEQVRQTEALYMELARRKGIALPEPVEESAGSA
jgi:glycosyltransferase involved in cell wall biosynthesis